MSAISASEIARITLLQGFSERERAVIAEYLKPQHFLGGKAIFNEGDRGGVVYFLISGEVEISQALTLSMTKSANYDSRDKSIVRLSGDDGPVFGEVSVFGKEDKRSATVKALTDCKMGLLEEKDFFNLLVSNHEIGYKIMLNLTRIVCQRLVAANQNVLKLTTALSLILEK
ncbi:MAG: cyclic nucleotide-binding domain-containing protein [Candidatus Marinimicrobia bacterium]|nr:cyclic nucleotide-binding domain-containing protein [Candidatus Neomarinimicrobiota bacterium]